MDLKTCNTCFLEKSEKEFGRDKKNRGGLRYACRPCNNIKSRQWRLDNVELVKKYKQEYRTSEHGRSVQLSYERKWRAENRTKDNLLKSKWTKAHPEFNRMAGHRYRCRKAQNGVYKISKKDMKKLSETPCVTCGNPNVTVDHIIPVSRGGQHSIGNLQPLCMPCNSNKRDKFMIEWRKVS